MGSSCGRTSQRCTGTRKNESVSRFKKARYWPPGTANPTELPLAVTRCSCGRCCRTARATEEQVFASVRRSPQPHSLCLSGMAKWPIQDPPPFQIGGRQMPPRPLRLRARPHTRDPRTLRHRQNPSPGDRRARPGPPEWRGALVPQCCRSRSPEHHPVTRCRWGGHTSHPGGV
jgi:hypothetical protein